VEDANIIAQRQRAREGREFEDTVARILNAFLVGQGLTAVRGKKPDLLKIVGNEDNAQQLIDFTRLPVKRRCTQSQAQDYPDSDLFILVRPSIGSETYRLLAIISCKVSFHARHTETCFWGAMVRSSSYVKYLCVTEDRDIYGEKGRSELGRSCEQPTAARRLLESFTDRVYIAKQYSGPNGEDIAADIAAKTADIASGVRQIRFDDPALIHHTEYCHLVRPLDDLVPDLLRWRADVQST